MGNELTTKDIEDLLSVERILTRILEKIELLDTTITSVTQSQRDFKTDMDQLSTQMTDVKKNLSKPMKDIKAEINKIHQDIFNQNERIDSINQKYDDLLKVIVKLNEKTEEKKEEEAPKDTKTPAKKASKK